MAVVALNSYISDQLYLYLILFCVNFIITAMNYSELSEHHSSFLENADDYLTRRNIQECRWIIFIFITVRHSNLTQDFSFFF
jgi:hypothetical protein